jgi:hypothetical protein
MIHSTPEPYAWPQLPPEFISNPHNKIKYFLTSNYSQELDVRKQEVDPRISYLEEIFL